MKKSILILLILTCTFPCWAKDKVNNVATVKKTDAYSIAQRNLKPFGLAYCISKFHRGDKVPGDIELAKSTYFEGSNLSNKAFNTLMDYIDTTIPKNMLYTSIDMDPMYFLSCVDMYESTEYLNLVNKLVKKYLYNTLI